MLKIFNVYQRQSNTFENSLINIKRIECINPCHPEHDKEVLPEGAKSIILYEDGASICSQTVSELNTLINGH